MIRSDGVLSDLTGMTFYTKVMNANNVPKTDKKGLQPHGSVRGTNLAQSLHESKIQNAKLTFPSFFPSFFLIPFSSP